MLAKHPGRALADLASITFILVMLTFSPVGRLRTVFRPAMLALTQLDASKNHWRVAA